MVDTLHGTIERPGSWALGLLASARRLSNTVPSSVIAIYAVRSPMSALGAHVGASSNASLLGSLSTSLTTIVPEHTAQSEAPMAANRSFVAT
jgi:hypothetical protein